MPEELSPPDLPNNYVYDLGFQPTLERRNHPYPSIVSINVLKTPL
jgi:hypothetical protein